MMKLIPISILILAATVGTRAQVTYDALGGQIGNVCGAPPATLPSGITAISTNVASSAPAGAGQVLTVSGGTGMTDMAVGRWLDVDPAGNSPITVTNEVIATGDGTTTQFDQFLAHGSIVQGSLSITVGATTVTDAGGRIGTYAGAWDGILRWWDGWRSTRRRPAPAPPHCRPKPVPRPRKGITGSLADTLSCPVPATATPSTPATPARPWCPAVTSVGVLLADNTQKADGTVLTAAFLSASEPWAAAAVELTSGSAAVSVKAWPPGNAVPLSGVTKQLVSLPPAYTTPSSSGGGNSGFVS